MVRGGGSSDLLVRRNESGALVFYVCAFPKRKARAVLSFLVTSVADCGDEHVGAARCPGPRTGRTARRGRSASLAHTGESGAAALSVRAIARELGLASSALYRYYPSRDALLTRLIIEAYNELGETVEPTRPSTPRDDLAGRYAGDCHAVRDWACAHPHEYALIYGSPVPGYAAPDDTIDPAVRVARVLSPPRRRRRSGRRRRSAATDRSTQRCSSSSPRSSEAWNSTSMPTSSRSG